MSEESPEIVQFLFSEFKTSLGYILWKDGVRIEENCLFICNEEHRFWCITPKGVVFWHTNENAKFIKYKEEKKE